MRLPSEKLIETKSRALPGVFLLSSSHNIIKDQALEAIFKLIQAQVSSPRTKPLAGTGAPAFIGVTWKMITAGELCARCARYRRIE